LFDSTVSPPESGEEEDAAEEDEACFEDTEADEPTDKGAEFHTFSSGAEGVDRSECDVRYFTVIAVMQSRE